MNHPRSKFECVRFTSFISSSLVQPDFHYSRQFRCSSLLFTHDTSGAHHTSVLTTLQMLITPKYSPQFRYSSHLSTHDTSGAHHSSVLTTIQMLITPLYSRHFRCSSHLCTLLTTLQMLITPKYSPQFRCSSLLFTHDTSGAHHTTYNYYPPSQSYMECEYFLRLTL
ncbi:hypothetical protein CHS0354_010529 [Potamilus streckersoni]|uniref:Uncharacterized protein n=1 Tax=Potamilus streckersoni TaxID=2493646 RepID=A0AAE0VQY4_9BIVA|nr:hypothetical protein CHS0354_010529 [Potamilus streckersoni]